MLLNRQCVFGTAIFRISKYAILNQIAGIYQTVNYICLLIQVYQQ
jgi:hypothetical protein